MKKLYTLEAVKQLITNGGFGTYQLFSMSPGEPLLAGSHLTSDGTEDTKMETGKLIAHLCEQLEILGPGNYMIVLKRSMKTQGPNVVKYVFTTEEEASRQIDSGNLSGLPADKLEELVMGRVDRLMAEREKQYEKEREISDLKRKIEELTKRKPPTKKKSDLGALMPVLLMGGSVFIEKQWPESKETVHKALDAIKNYFDEDDDPDPDDEEETGFTGRPT